MKSAKNKKSTIYMAALLLASTFFMVDDAEARGGRGGRAVGRFNGAIGQRFGGMSRGSFGQGLSRDPNSQLGNYSRRNNGHNIQTGNQPENRTINSQDTVREYQTDFSRDKSVSYSKEDGLTKTVNTQGTTAKGAEYDHGKTVNYNKEDGFSKTANAEGTTASGGQFDRNKSVSSGQGEGYNKNVSMQGTTGNGEAFEHERETSWSK